MILDEEEVDALEDLDLDQFDPNTAAETFAEDLAEQSLAAPQSGTCDWLC